MTEEKQNELAKAIQSRFPVCERPYREIASGLGLGEEEVIKQVRAWKAKRHLREVSAVMEGSVLGYDSALVCGRVAPERMAEVAGIIAQHPTVTHLYERNHHYNLWFTIAVPRAQSIENHLRGLEAMTAIGGFYPLRRTQTFKIGVVFDLKTRSNHTTQAVLPDDLTLFNANEKEQALVRAIQQDLPVCKRPFDELAYHNRLAAGDIIDFLRLNIGGPIRKYVATFRHRKLGVNFNAMTVWQVHPDDLAKTGARLAEWPGVSHCYARTTIPDFPYNLYSMLHGPDEESVKAVVADVSDRIAVNDYLVLHSTAEFKKERLRYFLPELDYWYENNVLAANFTNESTITESKILEGGV